MRGTIGASDQLAVTVSKHDLIARIESNRDAHRAAFEEALSNYKDEVIRQLEERIERIRKGKDIDLYFHLPTPEDHTEDYDRILDMLGMHDQSTIEIGTDDYTRFVRDDWDWKRQWSATNAIYHVGTAVTAANR